MVYCDGKFKKNTGKRRQLDAMRCLALAYSDANRFVRRKTGMESTLLVGGAGTGKTTEMLTRLQKAMERPEVGGNPCSPP